MRGSRTSGSRSPPSDRGLARGGLEQDRVDHAILTGPGRDPRESDLRLDRRAAGDDVARHEVRIRRVRLHRDDLDLLRRGSPAIQDVGEFRAQDADFPFRPLRAEGLQPLGPEEGVRRLVTRKPRSAPPFRRGKPACGFPLRTYRIKTKKPTRLPMTVPNATVMNGATGPNERPRSAGSFRNVKADTLRIPGMMRSPSPMNIASRSSPAAI